MVKSEDCAILLPKSFMVMVIFECNDIFNPILLGLWGKAGARCPVYDCLSVQKNGFYGCRFGVGIPFKDFFTEESGTSSWIFSSGEGEPYKSNFSWTRRRLAEAGQ